MHDHSSATLAPPPEHHDGLSVGAAAEHLGISKDAIRRRLRSGQLAGHQVQTRHGPSRCLHLDSPVVDRQGQAATVAHGSEDSATVAPGPGVAALVALVDRLQVENRQPAEVAAVWQERARALEERLALAPPQSPVEAPGATQDPEPTRGCPPLWWKRWLGAVYG